MSNLIDLAAERRRRRTLDPTFIVVPLPNALWLHAQWEDGKSTIFEDIAAAQRLILEKHT